MFLMSVITVHAISLTRSTCNVSIVCVYRHPPLVHPKLKGRDNSAGTCIKLAEKDQRILESQECIQVGTKVTLPLLLSLYLQFLQMKVTRLEHLVQIKDMKINELKRQIEMFGQNHQRQFQRR